MLMKKFYLKKKGFNIKLCQIPEIQTAGIECFRVNGGIEKCLQASNRSIPCAMFLGKYDLFLYAWP